MPAGSHETDYLREEGVRLSSQTHAQVPTARALDFGPAELGGSKAEAPLAGIPEATASDPMNVVLTGMAQLQGVVADLAGSPKQARQEVIKPGVTSLPELPAVGAESCLHFADWLHATRPALSDVSDTSEELWELVLREAKEWYARYLRVDAVSRLSSKPVPSADVTQLKWTRVSRRIETMIVAACPAPVREETECSPSNRVVGCSSPALRNLCPRRSERARDRIKTHPRSKPGYECQRYCGHSTSMGEVV